MPGQFIKFAKTTVISQLFYLCPVRITQPSEIDWLNKSRVDPDVFTSEQRYNVCSCTL